MVVIAILTLKKSITPCVDRDGVMCKTAVMKMKD